MHMWNGKYFSELEKHMIFGPLIDISFIWDTPELSTLCNSEIIWEEKLVLVSQDYKNGSYEDM